MNLIVDASVALKWLVVENDSHTALKVRAEHNLVAPDLMLVECRNALLNKVKRRELDVAEAKRIETAIPELNSMTVPATEFLNGAFLAALELREPIYDCIYLAAAITTDRILMTADASFVRVVTRSSIGPGRVRLLSAFAAGE
jgi:predicted nucleic acid-binding protein